MRICQVCKTANEPLATACANCNAPLSESDHHIVVEPAFIDDIPSLEEASRYQGANFVAEPEPPTAPIAQPLVDAGTTKPLDDAGTKPASPAKLSFVVSALSSITQGTPATSEPAAEEPAQEVTASQVAPPVDEVPVVASKSLDEIAPGAEDVTSQRATEPAPAEVLQRPSAARYRAPVPISSDDSPPVERPRIEMPPADMEPDMPPVGAPAFVAGGAEVPRAPVSAIRPYARKVAPARRPVSRRNIAIAAVFGVACIALLAIVPVVNAMHNRGTVVIATAAGTPVAGTSGAPDLTTTLATAPASSTPASSPPQPTAIPATTAPKPKPATQHHAPAIARNPKPVTTTHPTPRATSTPSAAPKPTFPPTPAPTAVAHPKPATPPIKPIAFRNPRKAIHPKPASLAAPSVAVAHTSKPVATAPPATVSQVHAQQPLVVRSSLGRSNTVSLATGGSTGLADLQWHKLSADQWQLLTVNGASAHRLGTIGYAAFFALTQNDLAHYSYAPAALPSISGKDLNGTVLAVRTTGGAYAKVYVQESNYATTVYYNIYAAGSSK